MNDLDRAQEIIRELLALNSNKDREKVDRLLNELSKLDLEEDGE